jgi:hypothetical protein
MQVDLSRWSAGEKPSTRRNLEILDFLWREQFGHQGTFLALAQLVVA